VNFINNENIVITSENDKPEDYPANSREARIESIYNLLTKIPKDPNYKIKEVLSGICVETDLNEKDSTGVMRLTTYEISLINSIYLISSQLHAEFIKIYLYKEMISLERQFRMGNQMKRQYGIPEDNEMDTIAELIPMLKLFYVFYSDYKYYNSRSFIDQIISTYNSFLNGVDNEEVILERSRNIISMFVDLSYVDSYKTFPTIKLDRNEMYKMFQFVSTVIKNTNQDPSKRPLLGALCLLISNFILKSRNEYNKEYLYKCLSDNVLESALDNFQVWMNKTSNLNDKREGKVFIDLFSNKSWIKVDWAKKAKIIDRKSYVSSFVKSMPTEKIKQRYGGNLLGYKNDKIASVLAPFTVEKTHGLSLGHIVIYDIIYSRIEAKEELNYLFQVINLFGTSDENKIKILEAILPYWRYSFKDSKWKEENERRYEILYFDTLNYLETEENNGYFKIKTSLLNFPDMAFVKNNKNILMNRRTEKLSHTTRKEYLFCENCLSSDFDNIRSNECNVCGSKSVIIMNKK